MLESLGSERHAQAKEVQQRLALRHAQAEARCGLAEFRTGAVRLIGWGLGFQGFRVLRGLGVWGLGVQGFRGLGV